MGLIVETSVVVKSLDGTPQVAVGRSDITVLGGAFDPQAEADLVHAAAQTMMAESLQQMGQRLEDWVAAVKQRNQS